MSETPETETPARAGGLRPRVTLWASIAVVAIIAIIAIFLVTNPVETEDSAAPEPEQSQPTVSDGACDVPVGDTSATPEMPDDLRWEAEAGWTWPVSDTYGPTQDKDGYGVCFARSPLGAALMGVSLIVEGNLGSQPEAIELYVMESPGKEVYRKTLAGEAPETDPGVFSGFIVDSFTPDEAQVTLVVSLPGSPTGYGGIPETFRWVDGDWKLKVLDDGDLFAGEFVTPSSGDFIAWGDTSG